MTAAGLEARLTWYATCRVWDPETQTLGSILWKKHSALLISEGSREAQLVGYVLEECRGPVNRQRPGWKQTWGNNERQRWRCIGR